METQNNMPKQMSNNLYRYITSAALIASSILLIPLLAMQFSDQVEWKPFDFAAAWFLLFSSGLMYKLVAQKMSNIAYRAAVGIAVGTSLFLVWSNLAVGIIGSEDNSANIMYLGVLAVLFIGALIARLKPYGMSIALFAAAIAQSIITLIAIIAELGAPENTPVQLVLINGFFIVLWAGSALLFQYASRYPAVSRSKISKS